MSYWRETNTRNNHGDEYAWSLEFEMVDDNLVVTVDNRDGLDQPYESSDIYVGVENSYLDFTYCEECAAAGYEEYFIANLCNERGYVIRPRDAKTLTEEGAVTIEPLGKEFDEDVKELINNYFEELEC